MYVAKKRITLRLSESDINRAIREIEQYKRDFQDKVETYRKKLAEELAVYAQLNFGSAIIDDIVGGTARKPNVTVDVAEQGGITVVVADGEDAVWCEFGAGVYHNGSVGSSPHPQGKELGFTIGSYGKGYGKGNAWGYYDDNEQLVITRGTPATMPMYNATLTVLQKSIQIAKEVFG